MRPARTAVCARSRLPWRGPTEARPFPSLGWAILGWTYQHLPSPADEKEPLVYTDEQARRIVRWFEIDPHDGEYVYTRLLLEEAKGYGKSPFAATLNIIDFKGPVCFDGWDAKGEPVGVPWGTGRRPPAWIQIAAVSEDQTDNTYGALYAMLSARNGAIADDLRLDVGRTKVYDRDSPGKIEPVTASAGSREGQRLTDATLDETHLWTPRNGGVKLAGTLRRNVAKMGGRVVETTNAPVIGGRSVAEKLDPDIPTRGILAYAKRARETPQPDWTDERLRDELAYVYEGAPWADPDRLVRELRDPATDWDDGLRYWFNLRTAGAGKAVDPRTWDARRVQRGQPAGGTRIGAGFDGSISQDATVIRGCTADGYSFIWDAWEKPTGPELQRWLSTHPGRESWEVDRIEVNESVARLFATYSVGRMNCDTPKWKTEIANWAVLYGEDTVLAFDTFVERRFAPAVDRWLTGIRSGDHTHDGDALTDRHVKAAHLRKAGRVSDEDDDGRTMYVLIKGEDHSRIDAAVTDVLAYEAAMTMPPEPIPTPTATGRVTFIDFEED